jgi:hypothetical protein
MLVLVHEGERRREGPGWPAQLDLILQSHGELATPDDRAIDANAPVGQPALEPAARRVGKENVQALPERHPTFK